MRRIARSEIRPITAMSGSLQPRRSGGSTPGRSRAGKKGKLTEFLSKSGGVGRAVRVSWSRPHQHRTLQISLAIPDLGYKKQILVNCQNWSTQRCGEPINVAAHDDGHLVRTVSSESDVLFVRSGERQGIAEFRLRDLLRRSFSHVYHDITHDNVLYHQLLRP